MDDISLKDTFLSLPVFKLTVKIPLLGLGKMCNLRFAGEGFMPTVLSTNMYKESEKSPPPQLFRAWTLR